MPAIRLQPKQAQAHELMRSGSSSWIGVGGGRGAAKSGMIDRVALALMMEHPGSVQCIVMRNFDQVRKYHIEPLLRAFPELQDYYTVSTSKLKIPCGNGVYSELDFSYAENLADVERRFRSANYRYIFVDQAEQFVEPELREMKQACRWPATPQGTCKMLLAFNMGGVGIQTLKKWFHTRDYNKLESPADFAFIHVFPWDNVEWVRAALAEDGYTEVDYYSWSDDDRQLYAAVRGDYTKNLNSQDEALRNRDWFGSWEALEGAFFGQVFDRLAMMITNDQAQRLIQKWDALWMSQDWGKAHYTSHHWHAITLFSPSEAKAILGWDVNEPVKAVITHREFITMDEESKNSLEMTSKEVAREIVERTPVFERENTRKFFLSPDAFGDRDTGHTIAENQAELLRPVGIAAPQPADNDRVTGWQLMTDLMKATKVAAGRVPHERYSGQTVWLISAECPEALDKLPVLMRDPKNIDDVLKTDKSMARLEQDVADDLRYGLKSYLKPKAMPKEEQLSRQIMKVEETSQTAAHFMRLKETLSRQSKKERPYWQ